MITDSMYRRFADGGLNSERDKKNDRANPHNRVVPHEIACRMEKLEDEVQSLRRIIERMVQNRDFS